ncbi:MAG: hypothetical protein GX220_05625 [Treponema sp.]|nr:hypothetical protein [Treponema sp.]
MKFKNLGFLILVCLIFCGCSQLLSCVTKTKQYSQTGVRIASWNVQTFFDAVADGTEYAEFQSVSSKWTEEKYKTRVTRLCEVLVLLNCDVVILQEVEKETLAYDIANNLKFQTDPHKAYIYSCFAKENDGSIGNMILSRLPLNQMKLHQVSVNNKNIGEQPQMRPIMEVSLFENETEHFCTLFVCHWKSKSSGVEESEVWRKFQEQVLADRILENYTKRFLALGDFNKDIYEFEIFDNETNTTQDSLIETTKNVFQNTKPNVLLHGSKKSIGVFSPWLNSTCNGSYFYNDSWEKIDHFFCGEQLQLTDFQTVDYGPHVTEDGKPIRFVIYSGEGYSDHLPITCRIK